MTIRQNKKINKREGPYGGITCYDFCHCVPKPNIVRKLKVQENNQIQNLQQNLNFIKGETAI